MRKRKMFIENARDLLEWICFGSAFIATHNLLASLSGAVLADLIFSRYQRSAESRRGAHDLRDFPPVAGPLSPPRRLVVPIYMIFPRLFSCPTMRTDGFTIEFEVNLIVVFADGYMVTENFPLTLYRSR